MKGILLVDKPQDWTSNDVVAKLKGVLHERRLGHSGTLDPMATGLLVVFAGRATRAVEFAEAHDKKYIAGLKLGFSTDTQDVTGTVLKKSDMIISEETLKEALNKFTGTISQVPPMYSAIKVNGKRLYEMARQGVEVERASREITIHYIKLLSFQNNEAMLEVHCSKGTYIRTLCNDIGEYLGCFACMSSLRRINAGAYDIQDALTLDRIKSLSENNEIEDKLLPVDSMFPDYVSFTAGEKQTKKIKNGNEVKVSLNDGKYKAYSQDGEFLCIGCVKDNIFKTTKSFFEV